MAAVKAYAYENEIDKIMVRSENDRIGIVSFGKSYYDLREALEVLGMDDEALRDAGIRLYEMGMIAPVEPKRLCEFAEGLEEIVVAAAHLEGKYAQHLDQTGLAQKGGAVTANISLCDEPYESAFRIPSGQSDLLLAFDFLASVAQDNLDRIDASRTTAIVNSHQTDTAFTVTDINTPFPKHAYLKHQLERHTKAEQNVYLDANKISEILFANEQSNNVFMLGVAYQSGRIPLEAKSIEAAIKGNGVSVERNINAFRWGKNLP